MALPPGHPPPIPSDGMFELLVGHQWPGPAALPTLGSASRNRLSAGEQHDSYSDLLRRVRSRLLSGQEGATAEDIEGSFVSGESHVGDVAGRNRAKAAAYDSARQSTSQLYEDLKGIADKRGAEIREVLASNAPTQQKVASVTHIVVEAQAEANARAVQQAGNVLDAIQKVLDAQGAGVSAREFTRRQGITLDSAFRSVSRDHISTEVHQMLTQLPEAPSLNADSAPQEAISPHRSATGPSHADLGESSPPSAPATQPGSLDTQTPGSTPVSGAVGNAGLHAPATPATPATAADTPAQPAEAAPAGPGSHKHPGAAGSAAAETSAAALGSTTRAPVLHTVAFTDTPLSATAAPLAGTAPAATVQADAEPIPAAAPTPPVIAATAAPALAPGTTAPPMSAPPIAPPAVAHGPLPAYGADFKPSAAPVTPAAPASAPATSAGGAGPAGHPAVLRRPGPVAPAQRAVATSAAAAAAGEVHTRAARMSRLRRLLHAVAGQQPQLRWAVGDFADGGIVLVTDLAHGWIPPGVQIPTGVRLLQPATRPGGLSALLRGSLMTETYRPGERLSPIAAEIPMSIRARDTATVEDIGWELAQATRWRDGLPRLAHTIAKAVSARTGLLDSEIQLLADHLVTAAQMVLAGYPTAPAGDRLGNWQLLATIDALVNRQHTLANYHFAWFEALTRGVHR